MIMKIQLSNTTNLLALSGTDLFCERKGKKMWWIREVSKEIGKLANNKRIRKLEESSQRNSPQIQ